ncbi:MAG: hypothetical protein CFE47_12055 [Pseudomonas sp. PGPPP1]|nr:MAG: hypothetical protein CFE47_12055 [Pseudomonas sp. PGPPP1]
MHSLNYAVGQMTKLHVSTIHLDESPHCPPSSTNDKRQIQAFAWMMFALIAGPMGLWLADVSFR